MSNKPIIDIKFITPNIGWVAVTGGPDRDAYVFKTEDGGLSWFAELRLPRKYFISLDFVDEKYGWVVGDFGFIMHTTDGGCTWTAQSSEASVEFWLDVDFVNEREGWIVGGRPYASCERGEHVILHTTNGGLSWSIASSGLEGVLQGIHVLGSRIWAVGGPVLDNFCPQLVARSSDNGITWTKARTGITGPLRKVKFANQSVGYAVGFATVKTTDNGMSWNSIRSLTYDLEALSRDDIRLITGRGIERSKDGGKTWTIEWERTEAQPNILSTIFFLNDSTGWAAGGGGAILKYDAGSWKTLHPK